MYSIKSEWAVIELIESDLRQKERNSMSESLLKKYKDCYHAAIELQVLINQLNVKEKSIKRLKKKVNKNTTILCKNIGELFASLHQ